MKTPESYGKLILISLAFLVAPIWSMSVSHIWWGFGYVPVLPLFFLISFFILPSSQYLIVVLLGSWWYDLLVGTLPVSAILAAIISIFFLFTIFQLIASRSLLSDILTIVGLCIIWHLVLLFINILVQRVSPLSPDLVWSWHTFLIGIVGVVILQLFIRRYILLNNIVPRALL